MTDEILPPEAEAEAEAEAFFQAQRQRHVELERRARAQFRQYGTNAIVRLGGGRGFVVESRERRRFVITAAHCLPQLPEVMGSLASEGELSYSRLLAPLGEEPSATGCCRFVDPVADLAVLEDHQLDETFGDLTDYLRPLRVARMGPPETPITARILGLDGQWFEVRATLHGPALWLEGLGSDTPDNSPHAGLSGSPILDARGRAIAVFVTSGSHEPHGPQPVLGYHLSTGLWRELNGRPEPVLTSGPAREGLEATRRRRQFRLV